MLSHCNCSSKAEESNKTCLQIVSHLRRLLQTGPNMTLKATVAPFGVGTPALTPRPRPRSLGRVCAVASSRDDCPACLQEGPP